MDTFLQRKAMATFHYSLREKGMLLLGKSESTGISSDLFAPFNETEKIFTRKSVPGRFIHVAAKRREEVMVKETPKKIKERSNDDFHRNADDIILAKAPAGVIVNDQMEIVQFRGSTGDWLEPSTGKPSLNLMKMAKHGLILELRTAIHKSKLTGQPVTKHGISLSAKGWKKLVTIEVIPLQNTINAYFLILFNNDEEILDLAPEKKNGNGKLKISSHEIRSLQLENELSQTREDMRTITEDQEAGNEELLSANEELVSHSEELRSLNEELEISKEELQSTVEELSVANQELGFRNEQLNISRQYAEAIVTTIREPLIILDKDLRIKSANSAFYKTFQKTERETEGKLFYELGNNQWNIPDLRKILDSTLNENGFYESYEVRQNLSVGERTMLLNARKIVGEGSNEHLILLAIEDITERRILEDNLKKSADYLKAILESSPQIASTSSAAGAVTYFNKFYLDYAGVSFNESITWGWQRVIHPDMQEDLMKSWMHSVTTGANFSMEVQMKRHDGVYRWHISRAIPMRNSDGTITSWVGTATDIHEQKMFSEQLEKKVKERTRLLKESNIELEHSNKNLEQFAFIASHDLQEPLRKIKTFSNILSDNFSASLSDEGRKLVSRIITSSERMSSLIQDVLNFSRINNSENAFVATDLTEILKNVVSDFDLLITEKNAVINHEKLPNIIAIPLQINQLFYNLISNSLKFVQKDVQPVISITSRKLASAEQLKYPELNKKLSYCEIIFEDNGIGFNEKYKEKIFMIFQRLNTQYPGTGIGLALCKKIVINHHGEMFAEAKENAGSVFHIILPLNEHRLPFDLLTGYVE
jgi:two-component system CheB/CheR fusion protein